MAGEQEPKKFWDAALKGVDLSKLGQGKDEEYPTIPPDELSEAFSTNPLKYSLMRFANENILEARAQAEGTKPRERKYHDMGWSLSIETPQGLVGLWSCWLGNKLYLGYPKLGDHIDNLPPEQVVDDLVIKVLGLEKAKPVRHVRQINETGQIVGYQEREERQWTKFYGPMEVTGGRVWVDHSTFHSTLVHFPHIDGQGRLQEEYYGHDKSNGIYTFEFSFYNKYAPKSPTAHPEAIQKYKDRFIHLAGEIAFLMGGAKAINIDYGFSMVPEDLYREGYENIKWLKGDLGERKGWGGDVVRGSKGDSTVILKSGNSVVPWLTILHTPTSRVTSPQMLSDFIKEDILWF